jgi:hypothetical protein
MMSRRKWIVLLLAAACGSLVCGPGIAEPGEAAGTGDSKQISSPVSWWGARSRIAEPTCARITSENEWRALWLRHIGVEAKNHDDLHNDPSIPKVDFGTHMVVAIFGGAINNTQGLYLWSATETAEQFTLRYSVQLYNNIRNDPTTPYGIFVLPRSEKRLVIEELGHNDSQGNPTWRRVKDLPALKTKE